MLTQLQTQMVVDILNSFYSDTKYNTISYHDPMEMHLVWKYRLNDGTVDVTISDAFGTLTICRVRLKAMKTVEITKDRLSDRTLRAELWALESVLNPEFDTWTQELDAGIHDLVVYLRKLGYRTIDSGDGSKHEVMEGALQEPHVFGLAPTDPDLDLKKFADDLLEDCRASNLCPDPLVEVCYSPVDLKTTFSVFPSGYYAD